VFVTIYVCTINLF